MELTKKEKIAWLRTVPLFKEVSPRSLALIADKATVIEYPAGRYIVRQGQVGTGCYLIIRGRVRVERYLIIRGRVRVERSGEALSRLGPGDFFGELSVLDQLPRIAHVVTEEPTVCLGLASWDFTKLLEQNPKITLSILREVARRLRAVSTLPHH